RGQDGGVVRSPGNRGLTQESILLLVKSPAQPLQGNLPADLRILGQPDSADPAARVELPDNVPGGPELRRERRGCDRGKLIDRRRRRKGLDQKLGGQPRETRPVFLRCLAFAPQPAL